MEISLNAFGAEHSLVEWKIFPRLKTKNNIVLDLELYAALLPAETAMSFDNANGLNASSQPDSFAESRMRPKLLDDVTELAR